MLGRQDLLMQPGDLAKAFAKLGLDLPRDAAEELFREEDGFVEPLLRLLGADDAHSLDGSDYERPTLVHDLNEPVPDDWHGRYSLVWDGGTLEHVFNFPVAIRNAMQLTEVGGHFMGMTPANNWMGHGFFQFSPELWFRVLSPENGFEVVWMLIKASRHPASRWYRVRDPMEAGERVTLTSRNRGTIYVLARRTENREVLAEAPQQSDYAQAWATGAVDRRRSMLGLKARLRTALNERLSTRLTDALFTASLRVLPTHDRRLFEAVDLGAEIRRGRQWSELESAVRSFRQPASTRR